MILAVMIKGIPIIGMFGMEISHLKIIRFFAPVLLSAHKDEYSIVLNLSNETVNKFNGIIKYKIISNSSEVIFEGFDYILSDNYFDMSGKKKVTIDKTEEEITEEIIYKNIKVSSVYDI